jgi:xylulokinase
MMGVTLTAGGALQWFGNTFCQAEMAALKRNAEVYNHLIKEAEKTPAGAEGLMFLPYLAGERTPHADPEARGSLVGLTLKHNRGHVVRAVLEGVTYALRDSLAIMEELGVGVRQIRATGGGAKSPLWRQLQADVLGKTVVTMAADEGPAYGVALLAAVGGGEFNNIVEACGAAVTTTGETKPVAKSRRYYDHAFPVYQQLYQSLRNDFRALGKLA